MHGVHISGVALLKGVFCLEFYESIAAVQTVAFTRLALLESTSLIPFPACFSFELGFHDEEWVHRLSSVYVSGKSAAYNLHGELWSLKRSAHIGALNLALHQAEPPTQTALKHSPCTKPEPVRLLLTFRCAKILPELCKKYMKRASATCKAIRHITA